MLVSNRLWQVREITRIFPEVSSRRVMGWCEKELLFPRGRRDIVYGTGTPREFDLPNLIEIEMILALQQFLGEQHRIQYVVGDPVGEPKAYTRHDIARECIPYLTGDAAQPKIKALLVTTIRVKNIPERKYEDAWLTCVVEREEELRMILHGHVVSSLWVVIHMRPLLDRLKARV
jgi:hypothetical protein